MATARKSVLDGHMNIIGVRSDKEVAAAAGCTMENVRRFRKKHGIPAKWRGETVQARKPAKKKARKVTHKVADMSPPIEAEPSNGGGAPVVNHTELDNIRAILDGTWRGPADLSETEALAMRLVRDTGSATEILVRGTDIAKEEDELPIVRYCRRARKFLDELNEIKAKGKKAQKAELPTARTSTPTELFIKRFEQLKEAGVPVSDAVELATELGPADETEQVMPRIKAMDAVLSKIVSNLDKLNPEVTAALTRVSQVTDRIGALSEKADKQETRLGQLAGNLALRVHSLEEGNTVYASTEKLDETIGMFADALKRVEGKVDEMDGMVAKRHRLRMTKRTDALDERLFALENPDVADADPVKE